MDNPTPIPQNRLQAMLGGARALIDKVENTNFNSDEYQASIAERRAELQSGSQVKMLNEHEVAQLGGSPQYGNQPQQYQQPQQQQPQQQVYTGDQAALNAQFNQQFNAQYGQQMQAPQQYQQPQQPQYTGDQAARIANSKLPDDIKEAMAKSPIPQADSGIMGQSFSLSDVQGLLPQNQPQQNQPQHIQEGVPQQNMTAGMTEREMRNIIREEVLDMMSKYFGGDLNEDLEKKLLQKLIKEGKIKTVPKKRTTVKKK